ncbi:unnamed protein product, partial [Amoebophrya sp. A120]|eukprot:GSA120T00018495001.1
MLSVFPPGARVFTELRFSTPEFQELATAAILNELDQVKANLRAIQVHDVQVDLNATSEVYRSFEPPHAIVLVLTVPEIRETAGSLQVFNQVGYENAKKRAIDIFTQDPRRRILADVTVERTMEVMRKGKLYVTSICRIRVTAGKAAATYLSRMFRADSEKIRLFQVLNGEMQGLARVSGDADDVSVWTYVVPDQATTIDWSYSSKITTGALPKYVLQAPTYLR